MIYAFALTFDSTVSRALISYSEFFAAKSQVLLDTNLAIPHATLVQFDVESPEVEELWSELNRSGASATFDCSLAGLCLLPAPSGECWVEIPVLGGRDLADLQLEVLNLPSMRGRTIYNGTGRNFRPHVTLALYESIGDVPSTIDLPADLLRLSAETKISLGPTGPNYTFNRPAFSAGQ